MLPQEDSQNLSLNSQELDYLKYCSQYNPNTFTPPNTLKRLKYNTWLGLTHDPLVQRYSPEMQALIGAKAQPGNVMSSTAMSAACTNLDAVNWRLKSTIQV